MLSQWSFLVLVLSGLFIGRCDSLTDPSGTFRPGYIELESAYILGEVKNTRSFIFDFSNRGDTDITGITISSSNPAFIVEPNSIPVLKSQAKQSLSQTLQVTVIHGTGASGLNLAETMPMGTNETRLTIRGRSEDLSGESLRFNRQTILSVSAKLLDVEVYDINGIVPLDSITGTIVSGGVAPYTLRTFKTADGPIRAVNTGNVDMAIRIYRRLPVNAAIYEEEDVELLAGEEINIERENQTTVLRIDGNGTISSQVLRPIENDGMIYLGFVR